MKTFSVVLDYERSTKGTHVFVSSNDKDPLQTQYIKRDHFGDDDPPEKIRVTVEEA